MIHLPVALSFMGGVSLDLVVPDFIKREGVPILPGRRPHHASVPEDVGDTSEEVDWQHPRRYHLGRDSLMWVLLFLVLELYSSAFRWENKWKTIYARRALWQCLFHLTLLSCLFSIQGENWPFSSQWNLDTCELILVLETKFFVSSVCDATILWSTYAWGATKWTFRMATFNTQKVSGWSA